MTSAARKPFKTWTRAPLHVQLIAGLCGVEVLAFGLAAFQAAAAARSGAVERIRAHAATLGDAISYVGSQLTSPSSLAPLQGMIVQLPKPDGLPSVAYVTNKRGEVVCHSSEDMVSSLIPEASEPPQSTTVVERRRPGANSAKLFEVTGPLFQSGERWGAFRAEFSLASADEAAGQAMMFVAGCGAAAVLLTAGLLAQVVLGVQRRLRTLTGAVEELGRGNLASRTRMIGDDDIGVLAARIDHLAECLAKADAHRKSEVDALQNQVTARTQGIERQKGELTETKRELEEARNLARSASKAKSHFMSAMSKELRSPVNAILGMADLALGADLEPQQRNYITCTKESALRLLATLSDISEFSKVGLETPIGAPIPFQLREMVGDTLKLLALRAQEKGIQLLHEVDPDLPEDVVADPDKVRQVLLNVVGASIRSGGRGEVLLRVTRESGADADVSVHFAAIASVRGSMSSTLGHAESVTMQLAELLGGKVWSEGSTFHLVIQLKRHGAGSTMPSATQGADLLASARVLIVDANETSRRLLRGYLERQGVVVEATDAMDEDQARSTRGPAWDVVILDVAGSEDCALLLGCAFRERGLDLGIVALRGPVENEAAIFQWRSIGAMCLTKPVKESEILEAVAACRKAARVSTPSE